MSQDLFQHSIGKEAAIKLGESGWWKEKTAREIVQFQLFTTELSMPFGDFHGAMESALGRPVWTHEFASCDNLRREFLGESTAPTMQEIIELIPAEKRVLIVVGKTEDMR